LPEISYNMSMTMLTRVGVLRGGPSNEYEISLGSGSTVLEKLHKYYSGRYQPRDIFIDREGIWHIDGVATIPHEAIHRIDVAWNALHGKYGEDGKVQRFFEIHGVPFTGSNSLASAIGMNKILTKNILKNHGIKTARGREVSSQEINSNLDYLVKKYFSTLLLPVIVKPTSSGSSIGISIVRSYAELPIALKEATRHSDSVLIEEYISGIEVTCGIIEDFRGQKLYALPPVEIRHTAPFFDYGAKYHSDSAGIVPATFSNKIKHSIEELACKIHHVLNLRHYSRSDFIIHPRRGIYTLEVNTLPGLTDESLMPKALRAIGSDTHELVRHVIELAMRK
jgi:D-alanine-D-alanine ligase